MIDQYVRYRIPLKANFQMTLLIYFLFRTFKYYYEVSYFINFILLK